MGGLALTVLGFALGGNLRPQSAAGIPVLLFLAFISGAGYVLWALLMKNNPVSRISVFGLIIPVMNVLLSALLNGGAPFPVELSGGAGAGVRRHLPCEPRPAPPNGVNHAEYFRYPCPLLLPPV